MRSVLLVFLFALCSLSPAYACVIADPAGDFTAVTQQCPADVTQFFDRAFDCAHWSGEEPYDAVRVREINAGMKAGRCETFKCDGKKLLEKYKNQPPLYTTLRTGWSQFLTYYYAETPETACQ